MPWTLPPTDPVDPTDELDPVAAEQAEVAAAVLSTQAVRHDAYVDPDTPGSAEAIAAHYTADGQALAVIQSDLQVLHDKGWRKRDNPAVPTRISVEKVTLLDGPPATAANAVVCFIDAGVLYEPASTDGPETVVNDDIVAYRSIQHLLLVDGTWRLDRVDGIAE